jgi:hypothetical protein
MRFTKKLVVLTALAVAMMAMSAVSANATYRISVDGAAFTGHVLISQSSATQVFKTSTGSTITCDTVTGEGTIENALPGDETKETHVGKISSLLFSDSKHVPTNECQSTISTFTECKVVINNLPYEVRLLANTMHIVNTSFTLVCESSGGSTLSCTYATSPTKGTVGAGTHKASFNQLYPLTAGGFLCPGSGTWTGTLALKTEAGKEVVLTNI